MKGWRLDAVAWDWLTAGIILGGFLLTALLTAAILRSVFRSIEARLSNGANLPLLAPVRGLIVWSLVLAGLYYSITSLDRVAVNPRAISHVDEAIRVLWTLLAFLTAHRIFVALIGSFIQRATSRQDPAQDINNQAMLIRKVGNVVIFGIALLTTLRVAGIDISTLLASGAIGGLAIALAAQDTFSNLFAGYFLAIDRPIRVGDFIKAETGQEGVVQEIGWRNTRLRTLQNNLIVIPNSKLSQSVLTNHSLPDPEMSLDVVCTVKHQSDLKKVEAIGLQVAGDVQQTVDGAVTQWEPILRWREFTGTGVKFTTTLRVRDYTAQYPVQSEFIERLHAGLQQAGIELSA